MSVVLLTAALLAQSPPDFDGDGARPETALEAGRLPEKAGTAPQPGPALNTLPVLPPRGSNPRAEGSIERRERAAPDPRAGREFRRVTGPSNRPLGPRCADGTEPPCVVSDPPRPDGSPALGGYYYGWVPDAEGKPRYVKVYIPHYGPLQEPPHNDPPDPTLRPLRPRPKSL
ncbi:MAG: hypothetical protein HYZ75_06555 [Elusimicrobia bacterium]|nr:hypothetical protein [Elusimicrobiota bacterium]